MTSWRDWLPHTIHDLRLNDRPSHVAAHPGLHRPSHAVTALFKNSLHGNFASANKSLKDSLFLPPYTPHHRPPPSGLKGPQSGGLEKWKGVSASPGRHQARFPGAPQDSWPGWSASMLGCLMDGKCLVCRVLAELCDNSLYFFLYKLPH